MGSKQQKTPEISGVFWFFFAALPLLAGLLGQTRVNGLRRMDLDPGLLTTNFHGR
jgi:hypothetical protein